MNPHYSTLEEIYAALPTIQCKRLCQTACTLIALSQAELDNYESKGVSPPAFDQAGFCDKLDDMGHCKIHHHRPLICRMFGVVPELPCPHGCVPDFILTSRELRHIWSAYRALSKGKSNIVCQVVMENDAWGRPTKAIAKMMQLKKKGK